MSRTALSCSGKKARGSGGDSAGISGNGGSDSDDGRKPFAESGKFCGDHFI